MQQTRYQRVAIAKETLEILKIGKYYDDINQKIKTEYSITDDLKKAVEGSILYEPNYNSDQTFEGSNQTCVTIKLETTMAAAERLKHNKTGILNFASAKNPGGGFLTGSAAQEESITRASGLYPCISQMDKMYATNAKDRKCLYYDFAIYSPQVPIIRNSDDELQKPYNIDIVTCPAVNANVARQRGCSEDEINETMRRRIDIILTIFAKHGCETIVLGAFGTGVFGNYPDIVAHLFKDALKGEFKNVFKHVHFAITDRQRAECFAYSFGLKEK
jgi:uncharacterized protein (TIGR02452 family)